MSQNCWDPNRSQYSCLDENLSIYSTSSKSRNQKYFTRRPLQNASIRNNMSKRKSRDNREFSGFYSPTHRTQALTLRENIEKAISKVPRYKCPNLEEEQNTKTSLNIKTNTSIMDIKSDKEIINEPKKSFRKKKPQIENFLEQSTISFPKQKQNPELSLKQIDDLAIQNTLLKLQILSLKQENTSYKMKFEQLQEIQNLKQRISELQTQLQHSKFYSQQLKNQAQIHKQQQENRLKTIDLIYNQSIKSLTQINNSLRNEIYQLSQKLKYAGMELIILKNRSMSQHRDQRIESIVQQRNKLKKDNRCLRVQIITLRRRLEEQTLSQFSLSRTNSEISIQAE